MKKQIWISVCLATLATGSVSAHKINPIQDKYKQDSVVDLRFASEPVHEEITQIARACLKSASGPLTAPLVCIDRSTRATHPGGNKYDALIRGVWWNDDPDQLLFAGRQGVFGVWLKDAKRIARTGRNLRLQRVTPIGPDYHVTYRSHYGDLQFIHAMAAADAQRPETTRSDALAWAEFAYAVATGRLDPETKMSRVPVSRIAELFRSRPGWTVNYLFAPKYRLRESGYTRDMAAGSLLHLVQDSYSAAHTKRAFDATPTCPFGRVLQFYSYTHQDPDSHAAQDTRSGWQSGSFTDAQDPVNASATMLAYMRAGVEWEIVKPYLENVVFCVDSDATLADPGIYATADYDGAGR